MPEEARLVFVPDSTIGEFDYGELNGYVQRREKRASRWDPVLQAMRSAEPARWDVVISGVDGAYREFQLPIRRGRTREMAVLDACAKVSSPADIKPDANGQFRSVVVLD